MTLTVVMLDTLRTTIAVVHENEHMPYGRRTVQIELTPEQAAKLTPRELGSMNGTKVYETIGPLWLEPESEVQG